MIGRAKLEVESVSLLVQIYSPWGPAVAAVVLTRAPAAG